MFDQTELDARYEAAFDRFAFYTRAFDAAVRVFDREDVHQVLRDDAAREQQVLCRLMDDELDVVSQVMWDYQHRALPVWDREAPTSPMMLHMMMKPAS